VNKDYHRGTLSGLLLYPSEGTVSGFSSGPATMHIYIYRSGDSVMPLPLTRDLL